MPSPERPEFGERKIGQHYQPRPGSYAVILSNDNQVAVVRTPQGLFLPGGGAEPGETPAETLRREVLEECGRDVEIMRPLGFAIEYGCAEGEGYFAKQCSFFQAKLSSVQQDRADQDHHLDWLPVSAAMIHLPHRSHSWAIAQSSQENKNANLH